MITVIFNHREHLTDTGHAANTFPGIFGITSRVRLQYAHLFAIIWSGIKLNTDGDSYM